MTFSTIINLARPWATGKYATTAEGGPARGARRPGISANSANAFKQIHSIAGSIQNNPPNSDAAYAASEIYGITTTSTRNPDLNDLRCCGGNVFGVILFLIRAYQEKRRSGRDLEQEINIRQGADRKYREVGDRYGKSAWQKLSPAAKVGDMLTAGGVGFIGQLFLPEDVKETIQRAGQKSAEDIAAGDPFRALKKELKICKSIENPVAKYFVCSDGKISTNKMIAGTILVIALVLGLVIGVYGFASGLGKGIIS